MIITLKNEDLSVEFCTKGAELQRLICLSDGLNYMWSGDVRFWGKFSPVLFPIVGALKDDQYEYQGATYTLPRHGFARDLDFDYKIVSSSEVAFQLKHSSATLMIYPFKFELTITYKLQGASLCCIYKVHNTDEKTMLFAIGGHPAFAAPLNNEGNYTDYYLEFNNDQKLTYHHIVNNLVSDETSTIPLIDKKLPLVHELFYEDALVFKKLKSNVIRLGNTKNAKGLAFEFEGFPYFGIWAAKDANFVCLEPWCGIADNVNHSQKLEEKEGMEKLEIGELWQSSWRISINEF